MQPNQLPSALQGRVQPMQQPQVPTGQMQQPQPMNPNIPPGIQPQGPGAPGMPQGPQGGPQGGGKPPKGKEILSEDEYAQLLRDNYASGLDWGENAWMMRSLGANFGEGSKLDKMFKQLYDLDYQEDGDMG